LIIRRKAMEENSMYRSTRLSLTVLALVLTSLATGTAVAQAPTPGVEGYEVEWVYRVRYCFIDEGWEIFRKYQVPILDRAKELGYILDYRIYHPIFHTDEAAHFDASKHEGEIARELFPDSATRKREENRRWELTTNHWDLPIYQVDTTKPR
jgi:hypothetical protein